MTNTAQDRCIWADAYALYQRYEDRDLAHNAKEIFHFARDAASCLIVKYPGNAFAYRLSQALVHYNIEAFKAAHEEGSPGIILS